ncbi:hypothetical protein XPA_001729 [Xanthoria parietina]
MVIDKVLPSFLLEGIDEHGEKVGDERAEGHPTSDACAEADLQSPALFEEGNQAPVSLLKGALFESDSTDFVPNLTVCANKILSTLKTSLSFLGFPKTVMGAQLLQSMEWIFSVKSFVHGASLIDSDSSAYPHYGGHLESYPRYAFRRAPFRPVEA